MVDHQETRDLLVAAHLNLQHGLLALLLIRRRHEELECLLPLFEGLQNFANHEFEARELRIFVPHYHYYVSRLTSVPMLCVSALHLSLMVNFPP